MEEYVASHLSIRPLIDYGIFGEENVCTIHGIPNLKSMCDLYLATQIPVRDIKAMSGLRIENLLERMLPEAVLGSGYLLKHSILDKFGGNKKMSFTIQKDKNAYLYFKRNT